MSKRFTVILLALVFFLPCAYLQASVPTKPVTYADGRLSNGIISVIFDEQGTFSINDAQSPEPLLSDARFGLPRGKRGKVVNMYAEDIKA